ncbi:RagB/SusD family nutrient uptake outer membrane protein [uncultured Acetobacteroides sp.]|uniref:RagB/SusD family nutrient uptake outer membrane protein n=1 Tax=uncultured Acetobacteroides sp. TaxID=1760811 RepID=UPI0029F5991A|nr:RagB/SusD family nutrient uptake outer membrane protein [uncultured Acetobacteroides sp.]
MKKLKYILGFIAALFLVSCEDYLDTPAKSSLEESIIFSTPDLAMKAVMGIHQSFGETNSYRGRFLPWYGLNSDVEWYNSSEKTTGQAQLANYTLTPTNDQMNTANNAWAKMYEGIERANMCISGLRKYGKPEPGTELGQILGEALTLRAIIYADLVRAWGDVPARFEPITTSTVYVGKSDRDVIYKQLIADLGEAEELVAWPNASAMTKTIEHVNKAFVKSFRARLCLVASGYSLRADGQIRRSTDPELSVEKMYAIAKKEVLDVYGSKTAKLEPTFGDIFKKNVNDDVTAGGEGLFEIPFADGRGRMVFTFGVKHNSVDQYTGQNKGGDSGVVPFLFYDYDVKDTRRDITCVPYEWSALKSGETKSKQVLNPSGVAKWYFGKFRYEWMTKRRVTSTNDDGVNKQYMRYAEVLLMAAEIMNELEGPKAAAPYLKEIRQRAFKKADWPTKVDAYVDALTDKESMFKAIVDEHAYEFTGEMLRKEALIRWNLLKDKMDLAKTKMTELAVLTGRYSDINSKLYSRYAADGETLQIYGLNRGETEDKTSEYTTVTTWISATKLPTSKINSLYLTDPNTRQFWPIWQNFIDSSNGLLKNDYGY